MPRKKKKYGKKTRGNKRNTANVRDEFDAGYEDQPPPKEISPKQNNQDQHAPIDKLKLAQGKTAHKLKQQIEQERGQNQSLESQNDSLKAQIAELQLYNDELTQLLNQKEKEDQIKRRRTYVRNQVTQYNSKKREEITMRNNIAQKQTKIETMICDHVNRLKEWDGFSVELKKEFEKRNRKGNINNHNADDDEKKHDKDTAFALLDSYTNCMELLRDQQSRLEDITDYGISLGKTKKELKNIIKQYTTNQLPSKQKYDALCASYANLKAQREHLQEKVRNMMTEINTITDEENKVNQQKCETLDDLNISVIEKEKYDELFHKCKSLIGSYKEFDKSVDNKAEELHKYFSEKWENHERKWAKWNVDDIICWFKCMIYDNKIKISQDIEWANVGNEMCTQQITGKSLREIEKNDLKLFGFMLFDDITQIYKRIRELVSKYPVIYDKEHGDGIEGGIQQTPQEVNIPKEYVCPISNKIMMDPVIYEGVTYDREYLMKCQKLPGSQEPYDEDEDMIKNRKLKQKIDAFLDVNPQFVTEGV